MTLRGGNSLLGAKPKVCGHRSSWSRTRSGVAATPPAMPSHPPPPSPAHILRTHSAAVRVLAFSDDNERLYSGDAEGTVVVTNTRSLRPLAVWKAHTDGLLGIQEWEGQIITYASASRA